MIRCGCELARMQGARATSNELQKSTMPIVAGGFGESRSIQVLERQAFGENAQKTDKEAMHRKQEQVVDVATPSSQRRPPPFSFPFSVSIVPVRFVSSARSASAFVLAYKWNPPAPLSPIFPRSERSFSTSFLPRWKAERQVVCRRCLLNRGLSRLARDSILQELLGVRNGRFENERKGSEGAWNSAWRSEFSNHNDQAGSEASDGCTM